MRKLLLSALLLIATVSFSQIERDKPFRGSNKINVYSNCDTRAESVYDLCDYLIVNHNIKMMPYSKFTRAKSDSFCIDYKGRSIYSKIYISSKIVNDTVVLKLTGYTDTNVNSFKITPMEYFSEENDRYSKGVLYKYVRDLVEQYNNKHKITYSKH